MAGLLPLLFALAVLEAALASRQVVWEQAWYLAMGGVLLWIPLAEGLARVLGRYRRAWLDQADTVVTVVLLAWFAWLCLVPGWGRIAPSHTLALVPWFLMQLVWWWCLPAAGIGWTRRGHVLHQMRFGLLPLALLLPIADLCDTLGRAWGIDVWIDTHLGRGANLAGSFLLMAGILVLLPAVLIRLWGARPLEDPEQIRDLDATCRQLGVPVAGVLRWPSAGGHFHNAVVLGLIPRLRWVLVSDDLLRELSPAGLRAVLGHELGHARHRHLLLYLLFAAATGMACWWVTEPLLSWWDQLPSAWRPREDLQQAAVAVLLLVLVWRGLFGVLSRWCERQADLVGAEAAGDPRHLCEALMTVARGAGIDPRAPSWRHDSISERMAYLERVRADPDLARRHHRLVRWAATILVLATAVLGLTLLNTGAFGPPA